jgi:hypothetical protein
MSLEKVVRPYQTREITPPSVIVPTAMASSNDKPVQIVVGKSWSIKSLSGSETLDISFYMEKWMKEKKDQTSSTEPPP